MPSAALSKIRLFGDGDRANYWIANGDVAEFVVQAVGNERALGKFLPAGGPDACPRCGGTHLTRISQFGSTPCKAQWRCDACLEPFDYFKCI